MIKLEIEGATVTKANTQDNKTDYSIQPGKEFIVRYKPSAGLTGLSISRFRSRGLQGDDNHCQFVDLPLTCPPEGCILGKYYFSRRDGLLGINLISKKPDPLGGNILGAAGIGIRAAGEPAADVPFVEVTATVPRLPGSLASYPPSYLEKIPTTIVGTPFQLAVRTSGNVTRLQSSGWTGPIAPKAFLGATDLSPSGVTWGGVLNMEDAGRAQVVLTATNAAGVSRRYTLRTIGLTTSSFPRCKVTGPARVAVGQTFNVQYQNLNPGSTFKLRSTGWTGPIASDSSNLAAGDLTTAGGSWNNLRLTGPGTAGVLVEALSKNGLTKKICVHYVQSN